MNKPFLGILFCLLVQLSFAQKQELIVKKGDNGLYLVHKVAPKESFYALGRLYNVSPKYIASYNKLDFTKGIQIDQKIRIPLTDTNFTQKGNSGTPVYFKVDDEKDLAKVSSVNRNVSVNNLRSWNDLPDNSVKKDAKLIVGFLLSKEFPSITLKSKPIVDDPLVQVVEKPVENPIEKPIEKPVENSVTPEPKVEIKEEPKKTEPVKETRTVPDGEGYFRTSFEQQVKLSPPSKNETVTAGIFKTTSGWDDAKYYLLMDGVQPGTIIKIINPDNNKAVFAKVLGEMAGIRQNEGYNIRISNAAAAALQVHEEDKFIVKVNY